MINVSLIVISLIFNEVKKKKKKVRDVLCAIDYLLFVHHTIDRGSFISITNSNAIFVDENFYLTSERLLRKVENEQNYKMIKYTAKAE